jgi:hypothetical protein
MEASTIPDSKRAGQEAAYQALQRMFLENRESVLEIEILPSSFVMPDGKFYDQEELSVGIPKKVLVAAFFRAREIFAARSTHSEDKSYQVSYLGSMCYVSSTRKLIRALRMQETQLQSCSCSILNI